MHRAQRSGGPTIVYHPCTAIGSTATFPVGRSSSGPIAKARETSPILGIVLKLQRMRNCIKHSHGASASTPFVYFEWSDVKRCELNCGSVASLHWRCSWQKLKTFQLFKRQRRHQPIRSPYANYAFSNII